MDLVIIWACIGLAFLILEFFTATTYGLDLAIGAFITAIYVKMTGDTDLTLAQILIFGVTAVILSVLFPKIFKSKKNPVKIGAQEYVGEQAELFKNNDSWKVKFDGVEYLVSAKDKRWFRNGKTVQIADTDGGVLIVEKVES